MHHAQLELTVDKASVLQVLGFDIPGTGGRYMYGTGIISVIGTSFTFLNVSAASIGNMMVSAAGAHAADKLQLRHKQMHLQTTAFSSDRFNVLGFCQHNIVP